MKQKPIVCLIDEDETVRKGWELSLLGDADVDYYTNHLELLNAASRDKLLVPSYSCFILGRYFKDVDVDTVSSTVPDLLRNLGAGPLFLNWQGYVTKEEVNQKFDGKLFHRYGVKWQTLRLRIQKFDKNRKMVKRAIPSKEFRINDKQRRHVSSISRPDKCGDILKLMAKKATGAHREKIEFYAYQDTTTGMKLLEAIYNKLLTDKNRTNECPSRYINSSPVIAQRILREALYG